MDTRIEIDKIDESTFGVRVVEGRSESIHRVTLTEKDRRKLGGESTRAEELIMRSFDFLLAREPKESILAEFDLPLIGHYFPEYERELKRAI
jgi:hypothetical protein